MSNFGGFMLYLRTWGKAMLLVATIVSISFAVYKDKTIKGITGANITIDGMLTEPAWQAADTINVTAAMSMSGSGFSVPDNDNDCSLIGMMFWDGEALYLGCKCKDDIHQIPGGFGANGWWDDGIEFHTTPDYNDSYNDPSMPYYGTYGVQIIKRFDEDGSIYWGTEAEELYMEMAQAESKGVFCALYSADVVNFDVEIKWTWNTFFNGTTPTPGTTITGFNFGLNDNDLGGKGDHYLRWTETSLWAEPNNAWGKIMLGPMSGVSEPQPQERVVISAGKVIPSSAVYDIFGRRINQRSDNIQEVLFSFENETRPTKTIIMLK